MKKGLLLLVFLISAGLFAQNDAAFEKGNQLYNQGKYIEAIEQYQAILDSGNHSAALYYNMANANYKLNKIAPTVYYYEKALQLAPNDDDIKSNLAFAQNMTIDAIDVLPEAGFSKIFNGWIAKLSYNSWARIAVICTFIFVLAFITYYFSHRANQKRYFFILSFIALACLILSVVFAFQQKAMQAKDKPAIVFATETQAKTDPNFTSEPVFVLHEGTKVQVLETFEDWKKIQIANGTEGWIPAADIKEL
ncbi:SH3 domain-containing protein [Spongiivirga citrea]|uniref:SH3 domain-containing protein n=1 Tax=Spongiivirga citrea TaxID=1481457 RepID=A0A6M0CH34_9FLAO|nr:SH3 domain-containing protein [Spongiivirga citrea]NER17246.1 SH3 domain-containing protein [Spongiivirga citrea]